MIQEWVRIAIQAPTGGGYGQLWRWLAVTDPEKRARLAELYRDTAGAPRVPDHPRDSESLVAGLSPAQMALIAEAGLSAAQVARVMDSGIYLADRLQDVPAHVIPCVRRSPSDSDLFEVRP